MNRSGQKFYESCISCTSRKDSVFCHLGTAGLTSFDDRKNCIVVRRGQVIFQEHSFPTGMYCMYSGKVKVVHTGHDGREQIVRLLSPGDVMGYRALLAGGRYSETAIALEDCELCFIPKDVFLEALRSSPGLTDGLMGMLARELGSAERKIADLARKPVRERLAEALLLLKEKYGLEPDGATLKVSLSREDISGLIGAATETAIRLLAVFRQENILALAGKKIRITDMHRLVRAAKLD